MKNNIQKIKTTLKNSAKLNALSELNKEKEKLSKISKIKHGKLKMEDYLSPNNIIKSVKEKQEIFKNRARMTQIKMNFPGLYKDNSCRLGCPTI